MKGKSIIELRDVHTGEVERYVDHNLVTNGMNVFPGTAIFGTTVLTGEDYFPLWRNWFSGLRLFENALEEDPDNYVPGYDETIVGYSSNEADTTDPKRGLFNISESGPLEDRSGVRLVWDFAQSQANGQISCIALTPNVFTIPKMNGMATRKMIEKNFFFKKLSDGTYPTSAYSSSASDYTYILEYNSGERTAVFVTRVEKGKFTLIKCTMEILQLSPAASYEMDYIYEETIEISEISNSQRVQFFQSSGDKWYAMIGTGRNTDANTILFVLVEIDKNTREIVKRNIAIPMEKFRYYDLDAGCSVEKDGYLYIKFGYTGISYPLYKMQISNPENIEALSGINLPGTIARGDCLFQNMVITKNGQEIEKVGYGAADYENKYSIIEMHKGVFLAGMASNGVYSGTTRYYFYANILIDPRIIYTINNLATPVIKTADKTMKITYILTNE